MANYIRPAWAKSKNIGSHFEKDTCQPWKNINGKPHVNEKFIKLYGADAHPDKEVGDFYKKKGL